MIDTKIACQCGNRFKFGMDLVNGRAPDGLICPTCGAPATAACNALVDFLSGKEPASAASGPRPVKEIKVTCSCGARYKFDLELAEKEMPSPVQCPGCQAELTPLANEQIRNYRAKHGVDLAAATIAAPALAPATATTPPPEPVAAPPPAAPAVTSQTTSPGNTPTATQPPAPASDAASTATPAPAAALAAPAAPAATPVVDPFGPAPAGKSSGPNLRPLEAPKPNRPPPGTAPAAKPAAPAAPASANKPTKPDAAKPNSKPLAAPAAASKEPSLALGVAGAATGAAIGAGLWFAVLKTTGLNAGFMAPVLGALAGFGARLLGRGASPVMGGVACVSAALAIGVMAWLVMAEHVNRQMLPQLKGQYDRALADAKLAAAAKTDAELRVIVSRSSMNSDPDGSRVTEADLKVFRATRLPKMLDLATGKTTRERYEAELLAGGRAGADWMDVWQESLGMLGLLWLIAGVGAAARIALK